MRQVAKILRLNLGGEGEEPDCINQQPPWTDLATIISRTGAPFSSLSTAGVPFLFCDHTNLPFADRSVDEIVTNSVPVDQGNTWLGPTISSTEIKRVLKLGGLWIDNGVVVHQKT